MNKNNIIGFHHFNIKAQNFDETVNFYKSIGFKQIHSWSLPHFNITNCTMMFHPKAGTYLEICDRDADMPTLGRRRQKNEEYIENAILHICFSVKSAEYAYAFAIEQGAKPLSKSSSIELVDPKNGNTLHVINSLVYSPNGEVIEFIEDSFKNFRSKIR